MLACRCPTWPRPLPHWTDTKTEWDDQGVQGCTASLFVEKSSCTACLFEKMSGKTHADVMGVNMADDDDDESQLEYYYTFLDPGGDYGADEITRWKRAAAFWQSTLVSESDWVAGALVRRVEAEEQLLFSNSSLGLDDPSAISYFAEEKIERYNQEKDHTLHIGCRGWFAIVLTCPVGASWKQATARLSCVFACPTFGDNDDDGYRSDHSTGNVDVEHLRLMLQSLQWHFSS